MSEITTGSPSTDLVPLGMYVHVPFCAKTCDFCAFYQVRPTSGDIDRYLDGIARESEYVNWDRPVSTVFWGGGTPGLLSAPDLRRLGAEVRRRLGPDLREWSVEMTPTSVTDARLDALREIGVTRISLGVQSFQPALLEALGRAHARDRILRAYDRIRKAGFASVNLDLIFAIPGQDEDAWLQDIREAVSLQPDHLSTYCLTFEEDTALWVKLSQGKVKLDVEREAQLYEKTWATLETAGYAQYEISNFARPGHACLHNLNTWRMSRWVGLGPSAASQHGGWRGTNVADLNAWLENVSAGKRATEDRAELTPSLLAEDALVFGLRMNEGVDLAALEAANPTAPWKAVERLADHLAEDGLAERLGGRLKLTLRGRLVADAIGSEIMNAFSSREAA
ncbi:coproporphyrinogen III oxidase [Opitutaceae bacterium EW11]|nr:coproporphyrinogen III oxidase [Opitutaceae bacterium EW11]